MTDNDKPLIQDEERSTQGGPQKGLGFITIVAVAIAAAVISGILYVAFF